MRIPFQLCDRLLVDDSEICVFYDPSTYILVVLSGLVAPGTSRKMWKGLSSINTKLCYCMFLYFTFLSWGPLLIVAGKCKRVLFHLLCEWDIGDGTRSDIWFSFPHSLTVFEAVCSMKLHFYVSSPMNKSTVKPRFTNLIHSLRSFVNRNVHKLKIFSP